VGCNNRNWFEWNSLQGCFGNSVAAWVGDVENHENGPSGHRGFWEASAAVPANDPNHVIESIVSWTPANLPTSIEGRVEAAVTLADDALSAHYCAKGEPQVWGSQLVYLYNSFTTPTGFDDAPLTERSGRPNGC
jgi:hypothetical protein